MKSLLLLGFFCCCQVLHAEDPVVGEMPLKYMKVIGLYDAMNAGGRKFVEKLDKDSRRPGSLPESYIPNFNNASGIRREGAANFADVERSQLGAVLKHAGCTPYDKVVDIPNDKSNVVMFPSCIVLKQCGGCCFHSSLTCKPTGQRIKHIQIAQYIYDGRKAAPAKSIAYISLQEHTACECQCKISESDCTPALHTFDDWDCKCKCKKATEKCASDKRWDENLCACRCVSIQNCGPGYQFNIQTCGCEGIIERTAPGNSGTNTNVNQGGNRPAAEVISRNDCHHLRCPRRYTPTRARSGRCICKYQRG